MYDEIDRMREEQEMFELIRDNNDFDDKSDDYDIE